MGRSAAQIRAGSTRAASSFRAIWIFGPTPTRSRWTFHDPENPRTTTSSKHSTASNGRNAFKHTGSYALRTPTKSWRIDVTTTTKSDLTVRSDTTYSSPSANPKASPARHRKKAGKFQPMAVQGGVTEHIGTNSPNNGRGNGSQVTANASCRSLKLSRTRRRPLKSNAGCWRRLAVLAIASSWMPSCATAVLKRSAWR